MSETSDLVRQNYELAYHISSNLEEADVQKARQDLEKMITSRGGAISFIKEPEKIKLAYPIKHQTTAYFGYFNFSLEVPEGVNQMREDLSLNNNVIRYLMLKLREESKKKKEDMVKRIAGAERRKAKMAKDDKKATVKTEAPKMEEKVIDEKLEEIIGKL